MKKKIKVLIADDHPVFRFGLRSAIETDGRYEVVGEATDGVEALGLIASTAPDIVILDIDMPNKDGIATAREMEAAFPDLPKLFLTLHNDRKILKSMKDLNVRGYVLKDSALDEILACVQTIMDGGTYISPAINKRGERNDFETRSEAQIKEDLQRLTSAELSILHCVAELLSNKDIAKKLMLSIRTVENHRSNICTKLDIRGTNALIKYALAYREVIRFVSADQPRFHE